MRIALVATVLASFAGFPAAFDARASGGGDSLTYRAKGTLFAKGVAGSGGGTPGWLVGVQGARFFSGNLFYLGGEFDFGYPTQSTQNNLVLVGGLLGWERVYGAMLVGVSVAVDYAQTSLLNAGGGNSLNNSIVLEPQAYAGFIMGGGWRLVLNGGYLNVPNPAAFSGYTFGIRFDHKTETTIRSVDD